MKRICPSVISRTRRKASRQTRRRQKRQHALEHQHQSERRPQAARHMLHRRGSSGQAPPAAGAQRRPDGLFRYLKKSELGSSTMTSLLPRKLCR